MAVRGNVFGSGEERDYYYRLAEQWGDDWRIYHNLPYLQIFDFDTLKSSLSGREQARLKKTSVDYTLCDAEDRPLMSVEFDGLAQGFNVGDEYHVPRHASPPRPWREEIMSLKLEVAHSCDYPFFVVGSTYFEEVTEDLRLTLVGGIIGTVLANQAKRKRIPNYLEDRAPEESEKLSERERRDIQDDIMAVEVQAEMDFNPLTRERWRRVSEIGESGWRVEPLFDPPLPDATSFEKVRERIEGMEDARLVGCRVTLPAEEYGGVSATAWIPNFDTPGFDAVAADLPEDIAFLLACEKLKRLRAGD